MMEHHGIVTPWENIHPDKNISAEKVSEFDSLYFVRTLPLWVISVDYLFQRIGLISYTQAWLFLIEHCLRLWSLN
jgi:hypothetical protein